MIDDDDDEEEFGIDWSDREGFQVRRITGDRTLWGPRSETPLFKRGMYVRDGRLNQAAQLLTSGSTTRQINASINVSSKTLAKLRRALLVAGVEIPKNRGGFRRGTRLGHQSRRLQLGGTRFGRLTAIYCRGKHPRYSSALWRCRCDCGTWVTTMTQSLASGGTNSCGCLRRELAAVKASAAPRKGTGNRGGRDHAKRISARYSVLFCADTYMKALLQADMVVRASDIPDAMIALKRVHIETHRELRNDCYRDS